MAHFLMFKEIILALYEKTLEFLSPYQNQLLGFVLTYPIFDRHPIPEPKKPCLSPTTVITKDVQHFDIANPIPLRDQDRQSSSSTALSQNQLT